jgi:hypothetical protein
MAYLLASPVTSARIVGNHRVGRAVSEQGVNLGAFYYTPFYLNSFRINRESGPTHQIPVRSSGKYRLQ